MRDFNWDTIRRSKDALRDRNANLPLAEKLRVLDGLRERANVLRESAGRASEPARPAAKAQIVVLGPRSLRNTGAHSIANLSMFGADQNFVASIAGAVAGAATTRANPVDPDV
jgi:hypothetical protein